MDSLSSNRERDRLGRFVLGETRPLEDRFWEKVDRRGPDECWEWTAYVMPNGYGTIGLGSVAMGKGYAHRVSFELHNGSIPPGMFVCHHCDNRKCVNPSHLFLGTQAENLADAAAKGRMERGEARHNTRLTDEQVVEIRRLRAMGEKLGNIAAKFGVSSNAVSRIHRRQTWKHVPDVVRLP